eukprot:jgi/Chrpa1/19953/Chrysochromulina_OHIO_Genome00004853-RA
MSLERHWPAAAVIDGLLYVVGGHVGYEPLDSVERFNPDTNAWEAVAPMSTGRRWAAAAALDGNLYVVGGGEDSDGRNSVARYDPATDAWEGVAPHPVAKIHASAAAVLDGKLYVMGGAVPGLGTSSEQLSGVARYDPATNAWEAVASLSTARSWPTAVVLDGALYAMGGYVGEGRGLGSVERYDSAADAWEAVPSMALTQRGYVMSGFQCALAI